ncbi:MAG TPA: DUF748 domain-containing protein, partial [Rhodoferax sp.]|nr:DUF748 domain-containing protein [Rhodoferax sp.]
ESSPWKIEVDKVAVRGGTVNWTDETTAPHAQLALRDLVFDAAGIALPFAQPLQFSGSALLASGTPDTAAKGAAAQAASLTFGGSATDRSASVAANVTTLPLGLAAPYLAAYLEPGLSGELSAQLNVDWKAQAAGSQASGVQIGVKDLKLDHPALTGGRVVVAKAPGKRSLVPALPGAGQIRVSDARIDLDQQTVRVGKVVVTDPHASVERGADKRWMFEHWLKQPAALPTHQRAASSRNDESKQAKPRSSPWKIAINEVAIDGGAIAYRDAAGPRPVAFEVTKLKVQLKDFSLDAKQPSPLSVSASIGAGRTEPGRIDYSGNLGLSPLSAQGRLQAVRLPLQAFAPYFDNTLNVRLRRADASFNGRVHYLESKAGPVVQVAGDSALEDLQADTVAQPAGDAQQPAIAAEPLLQWKALSVRGLDLAMKPGVATRVNVRETALSDFYARVIINPNGRINLQDLVKSKTQPGAAAPTASKATTAAPTVPVVAAASAPAPIIHIGPISLINGKVLFSDHFIKPNYSADLTQLTGKLSAFSSVAPAGAPQLADLTLSGRAEGTASLEITGKLNPLAKPLALDITGKVHDLELPPLSPYAVKYSGHEIERGKMSMDVHYVVLPDGQLTAKNNLVLNQLSFGEEVKDAPASLPVKLAVALLADRDGVINLDLPISGSLNDPQFSLGPIIFKAIINIIVKAVTAPFSLIANAFGGSGGQQLNTVVFAPGSATLTPEARTGLDKVAKVLTERPSLKMTVVGAANLDAERAGYRRERLNAMVRAEKRREMLLDPGKTPASAATAPASAAAGAAPATTVSESEYPDLLRRVYRHADITKPRNLIGMTKDIPQPEMESLLMANIPVTEDSMRQLALARGEAVKEYLASKQVPSSQLFLGAPKAQADQAASSSTADAKWIPHADLSLATQ